MPDLVIVATGSEVPLAIAAAKQLPSSTKVRVVSMPCTELYLAQTQAYREQLIPQSAKKVSLEAGTTFGWASILGAGGPDFLAIGIDHVGESAPAKVLAEKVGFTPDAVAGRIKQHLGV